VNDLVAMTRSELSGLTWLALDGELDVAGAGLIGGELPAICDATPHVVIDTRGLRFVDLAGLRLIAGLQRRQCDRGGRFSLVAGAAVRRLARLAGLHALLAAEETPDVLLGLVRPARARTHDADPSEMRARVATACQRQADLVARMVHLCERAQATLATVRTTNRTALEGRARRAAAG
jgi:anti-anti-sigma factor